MFFKKKEEKTIIEAKKFSEPYFPLIRRLDNTKEGLIMPVDIDFESANTKDLIHKIEKLELENLDLKNEISYYERYIKFLEDNYIFILKSSSNMKEIFDKIGEQNEKLD